MVVLRTVMLLSRITVKNDSTNLPMCISLLYLLPVKRPLQQSFLMSFHLSTSVFLSPYTHWFHTGKTSIQAIKHLLILIPNVEYAYPFFPINTLTRLKAHIDSWTIQWTFFNSISCSVYTMPPSLFCIHILLELFLKFFTKYFLSLNSISLLKRMPALLLVYLVFLFHNSSVVFGTELFRCCSVTQSCPTLCGPMDCSTPGFTVLHHIPERAQTHIHWVGDAIQSPHPLSFPSPPLFSLSQHQGLC